jgi:hypothetical protein
MIASLSHLQGQFIAPLNGARVSTNPLLGNPSILLFRQSYSIAPCKNEYTEADTAKYVKQKVRVIAMMLWRMCLDEFFS